jgi:homoserine dehydrogenase
MKIAVIGHGVVGSGVSEILLNSKESFEKKLSQTVQLKYILDIRDFDTLSYKDLFIKDFSVIENDDEVDVVVEAMGGLNPAYDFVKRSLLKGKNVVTSNKELVAEKGVELLAIAKEKGVKFLFEASVGGSIPIIRPLMTSLNSNTVTEIAGILNGTTNFILTKMFGEDMSFEDALKLAQDLGYAERDPSADVDGFDACRKISILAAMAFGVRISPKFIDTKGIRELTLDDVRFAEKFGFRIKLIGRAKKCGGEVEIAVSPALIPETSPLACINDVFNGVFVRGDYVGDTMFYGRGAGKFPTASAVVADVLDCALKPENSLVWEDADESIVKKVPSDARYFVIMDTLPDNVVFESKVFENNLWYAVTEPISFEKLSSLNTLKKIVVLEY